MKVEKEEGIVCLDSYNSDLNLVIDASGYSANPLTNEGFAFMWAGARATYGVNKGKICFETKIGEHIDVSHLPEDEPNPHVVRVGFSVESSSMQLGEDPLSYGYGGTGKISTNCQFKDYGVPFQQDDVILALLNYETDPVEIGFAHNGKFLGWAYKINKNQLQGKALYSHVLTKNCSFEVNFGQLDKPWFPVPDTFHDYKFINQVPLSSRERGSLPPPSFEECEMIMMCGLPGAGKTFWAIEYAAKYLDKKYNVLGTNNIIDKMKVMGLPRKRNYRGRWDVLIQMATKCLNKLFEISSKLRRNYILDQTNVYPNAQRRKMKNFETFKRKAVVIVPTDEEYKRRCDKRDKEEGKEIPDQAIYEMKANFKLPEVGPNFDEVIFIELQREEAEELVKHYNEEGRAAVGPANKRFRPNEQSPSGGSRGGRNFGYDHSGRGGRDFNSPGPKNTWNDNSQGGFGQHSPLRGNFGAPRGFDGGRSGGYGEYSSGNDGGGYGGGSPGYGDSRAHGGYGRGGYRGGYSGRGGHHEPYNDGYGGPDNFGGYGRGYGGGFGERPGGFGNGGSRGNFNEGRNGGYSDFEGGVRNESPGSFERDADYGGGYSNRGGRRGGFNDRGNFGGGRASGNMGPNYDSSSGSGYQGRGSGRGNGSNMSYSGGGRGSANSSRWQSDTSQQPTQSNQVTSQSQSGGYTPVKTEPISGSSSVSSTYPDYNQSYSSYSSSSSSGYQSYGYQSQGSSGGTPNQQWGAVSSTTPPSGPGGGQGSSTQYPQWGQYYQQPSYNQYYGQQAGSTSSPGYGAGYSSK